MFSTNIDSKHRSLIPVLLILLTACSCSFKGHRLLKENIPLTGDEPEHIELAQSLISGKGFAYADGKPTAWRTPGFPLYLAFIYRAAGEDLIIIRAFLLLLNCLITPLLFWFTWLLFKDNLTASLAGVLWTFNWNSYSLATAILGEEPAALFLLSGFISGVYALRRRSILLAMLAGLLVGFSILSRGYLLSALIILPIWYLANDRGGKKLALASLTAALLILFGWMGRNAAQMGSFTLSTEGAEVVWIGNNAWARGSWDGWSSHQLTNESSPQTQYLLQKYPDINALDEVARAGVFAGEAVNELVNHPQRVIWLLPRKMLVYFSPTSYLGFDWIYLLTLPFFIVGCVLLLLRREQRHLFWLLCSPVFGVLAVCLLTFGDPRFRHPVDTVIVVVASYGTTAIVRLVSPAGVKNGLTRG